MLTPSTDNRRYPHALFFLDLLQSEEFRTALASSQVKVRSLRVPASAIGARVRNCADTMLPSRYSFGCCVELKDFIICACNRS